MVKKFMGIVSLIMFFNLILTSFNFADVIYLKDGHKEEGEIVEETEDYIIIFDPQSLWRIVIYKRYIDKIEEKEVSK